MCIVIDADTFSEITANNNNDFGPVKRWIEEEGHKIVYGGSTYLCHLIKYDKFRKYLRGLEHINRTLKLDDGEIDTLETFLKQNYVSTSYDDHHIVAILFNSGCCLACSHDQGFHELVKLCCRNKKKIKQTAPIKVIINDIKIYQNESHRDLLIDRDILRCCVT